MSPIKPPLPPLILERCREMRKHSTDAENLLWQILRNRRLLNAKFRRQHPVGGFIIDFYCHEAKLGIELDGGGHMRVDQETYDQMRSLILNDNGIRLIRFWNDQVINNLEDVVKAIWNELC